MAKRNSIGRVRATANKVSAPTRRKLTAHDKALIVELMDRYHGDYYAVAAHFDARPSV